LILQIINLSNKKTLSDLKKRFNGFSELDFYPGLGIEVSQSYDEIKEIINKKSSQSKWMKFSFEVNSRSGFIILSSENDLVELKNKITSGSSSEVLNDLKRLIENYLNYDNNYYQIGERQFSFKDTCLMGILNVTPDSFSDGGKYLDKSSAIEHGLQLIDDGVDVIDIGGESTRPGAKSVTVSEELKRIIPVIEGILKQKPDSLISIDTTKSEVARIALDSGAVMINDISGLTFDDKIADEVCAHNASLVVMHIKGTPDTMQSNPSYVNLIGELYEYLDLQTKKAESIGVKKIIIDPGIGFGKTVEQNYEVLNRLDDFKSLGYPIMIGVSRKSFLGKTFKLEVNERDIPTVITEAFSLMKGASVIRTHNIKNAKQLSTLYKNLN
jgi:dihydropteroate synthase